MRQAWRRADVAWSAGRDPRPPGSSCADGRRIYRLNGRPVRVALSLKGAGVADFEVKPAGQVSAVHERVVALRADLVALWGQVPAFVKPAFSADVSAIFGRLDELADMTKG